MALSPVALICIIIYTTPTDELGSGRNSCTYLIYVFVFSSIRRPVLAGKDQLDYLAGPRFCLRVSIRK